MDNINNLEYQDNQNDLSKEVNDILKMLDTKEWKDEFIKDLFASKEHLTKTFWLPLFKEQFDKWEELINALLIFCKSIDIEKFKKEWLEFQYTDFSNKLSWYLWEVDLYREIELINAYINYDLKVENTINISEILASASEKQMTKKEALDNARLTRFAYADIEVKDSWEITFIDTYKQKQDEVLALLDISDWNIKLKENTDTELTVNQKIIQNYLVNWKVNNDIYKNISVDNWKIVIADNVIPEELSKLLSWKINYNNSPYNNWDRLAKLTKVNYEDYQLDALVITEETNLLVMLLSIFLNYDAEKNISNYKSDFSEVIKNDYSVLEQIKDDGNWFSVTILEEKETNNLVLTVRWTNDLADIFMSDLQIGLNSFWLSDSMPSQVESLKKVLTELWNKYSWRNVKLLWHSLWWYLSEVSEWLDVKVNIIETISVSWPGWWDVEIENKNDIWKNCTKFTTNESISKSWTQSNSYTLALAWNEHSIDKIIWNIEKSAEEDEKYLPILDTKKLKDIF